MDREHQWPKKWGQSSKNAPAGWRPSEEARAVAAVEKEEAGPGVVVPADGDRSAPNSPWGLIRGSSSLLTSRVPKKFVFTVSCACI